MKNAGLEATDIKRILRGSWQSIPGGLLKGLREWGASLDEAYALLVFWTMAHEQETEVTEGDLARQLQVGEDEALALLGGLIAKGLLSYEEQEGNFSYSLAPLYARLFQEASPEEVQKSPEPGSQSLHLLFEGEFNRPLSPLEADFLTEWEFEKGYSRDMIADALRAAVAVGKVYFKYIDQILRDWEKKGVSSIRENEAKGTPRKKKSADGGKKPASGKYTDVYLN